MRQCVCARMLRVYSKKAEKQALFSFIFIFILFLFYSNDAHQGS
jgi:hypothetical protein